MFINNTRSSQQTQDESEVAEYRPSQQLFNVDTPKRKSMNNIQKKEIVSKWKNGLLEKNSTMKGSFVQIIEDGKVTGCICVHCENYYIGNAGETARQHKCDNKAVSVLFISHCYFLNKEIKFC